MRLQNDITRGDFYDRPGNLENFDYTYDANGNVLTDYNKAIYVPISYNMLNLPEEIRFKGDNGIITYTYDATGIKLRKTVETKNVEGTYDIISTTDYSGSFVYVDGALDFIHQAEGRIVNRNDKLEYEFFIKDHLGNTRVTCNDKGEVLQENAYYPFGMAINNLNFADDKLTPEDKNKYLYNGKELQTDLGLDWYDYGARFYDPQLGRWHAVDEKAEGYYSWSPYVYVRGNPILKFDPNGKWDVSIHVAKNRGNYGYGIAIVTDRNGNEVYRFIVRAQGVGGSNRMVTNSDTPNGKYNIPNNSPWINGGSRAGYGSNSRLAMVGVSGEIKKSKRKYIRIHGGRQEKYNSKTGEWTPVDDPTLKKTQGCLRAYDADMVGFKNAVSNLMSNDPFESPGSVNVMDDLVTEIKDKNGNVTGYKFNYGWTAGFNDDDDDDAYMQYINSLINSLLKNLNSKKKKKEKKK